MAKPIRPTTRGQFPRLKTGLHSVALGNMTQYDIAIIHSDDGTVTVGICSKGCHTFNVAGTHPSYVEEKLKLLDGDAANVSDMIRSQLGVHDGKPNGRYMKNLCTT